MAEFPDVQCWVKLIEEKVGKAYPSGTVFPSPSKVIVRYVVANDSHKSAGPLTVTGSLYKNGVKVTPGGQPNVVPAQQITLQPDQVWKKEFIASGDGDYVANILGDIGNFVNEEDEKNNKGKSTFKVQVVPT